MCGWAGRIVCGEARSSSAELGSVCGWTLKSARKDRRPPSAALLRRTGTPKASPISKWYADLAAQFRELIPVSVWRGGREASLSFAKSPTPISSFYLHLPGAHICDCTKDIISAPCRHGAAAYGRRHRTSLRGNGCTGAL